MKRVKFLLSLIFIYFFTILAPNVWANETLNLIVKSSNVYVLPNEVVAGQPIKLYAMVEASGNIDLNGEVKFFLGNVQIGETQPISIPAGGVKEEVFVNWTAPTRPFNFRVTVYSENETSDYRNDNEALSTMIYPLSDQDKDSIPDINDNCLDKDNPNQLDQDNNGIGDVCDENFKIIDDVTENENNEEGEGQITEPEEDVDNNEVEEINETESKTNNDNEDIKTVGEPVVEDNQPEEEIEVVEEAVVVEVTNPPVDTSGSQGVEDVKDFKANNHEILLNSLGEVEDDSAISDDIIGQDFSMYIETQQVNWNTYKFKPIFVNSNGNDYDYVWHFGDGKSSLKKEVKHTYQDIGEYKVVLQVKDKIGQVEVFKTSLKISFFNTSNTDLWLVIGLLAVVCIISIIAAVVGRKDKSSKYSIGENIEDDFMSLMAEEEDEPKSKKAIIKKKPVKKVKKEKEQELKASEVVFDENVDEEPVKKIKIKRRKISIKKVRKSKKD